MDYTAQKTLPALDTENGVDYGKPAKVLVEKGRYKLVWQPGGSYWSGMYSTRYSPATMQIRGIQGRRTGLEIHEGGRLSRKLIAELGGVIDDHFGANTAALIDVKATLVLPSNKRSASPADA
jgi:hypothetical protein